MAITYTPIATQTLGSTVSSVTFSSISSSYTDLVLVCSPLTTAAAAIQIRFNSDTGTNYSRTFMSGNGTTATSSRASNQDQNSISYSGANTTPYTAITHFQNYSNTTTNKTYISRSSSASDEVITYVGLWRSTAAISTILLFPSSSGSFTSGSTFTLYGIKAA
jgi:hypothetical protein